MLTTVRSTSSCCSGAFTGEVALAIVERTVNTCSKEMLGLPVAFQPSFAHDVWIAANRFLESAAVFSAVPGCLPRIELQM